MQGQPYTVQTSYGKKDTLPNAASLFRICLTFNSLIMIPNVRQTKIRESLILL